MNTQSQPDIPTLDSMFKVKWSGDIPIDSDYFQSESDVSDGSSEEWEVFSEAPLPGVEEEGSDMDDEEGEGISLTEEQVDMLEKHVTEFRAADLHQRIGIIKNCLRWIETRWQQDTAFNKKKYETLIRQYLYNKGRRAQKRSAFNLGRKWTYHDIVTDVHREELHDMALSLSRSKAGSAEYLRCYRKALKTIEEGLSEETRAKYRAVAKKWTEDKPPPRQQRRMMEKHSMRTFRDFARYVYCQFGMRIAILAAYCDGDGDPAITFFDINDRLGATSFKNRNGNWANDPMVQDFSKWATECFGKGPSDGDKEGGRKIKDTTPEIKLRTDAQGYPMLPSWESIKDTELIYKKYLIGRYLSDMYQMASANGKGRIPWTRLHQAQGEYILDEYLPAGVTLTQYHHIRQGDANSLLQHWTTRQAAGQIPFRFQKVDTTSRQLKRASGEGSVSAAEGPSDRGEGGPVGIRKVQAQGADNESWRDAEDLPLEDAQGGGGDTPGDPGPSKRTRPHPRPHHQYISTHSGLGNVPEEPTELPTKGDYPNPPPLPDGHPHQQPGPLTGGEQSPLPEHIPRSVMKKPWADKLKFLKSLSKDGKYQDLLREVDQMFLSNRVIYAKASTDHPTWASWTWAQAWLPEELHSGCDKPIWQWLQSQPYVPDVSSEGASGNSSVDRIALGIGCLLRDMEGMQFSEEFHPPHHVAHSNISFDVVPSIIHPVLENFLKIVRDHNNQIAAGDSQELPVTPPSTGTGREQKGKRRRVGQGNDGDAHVQNRRKVEPPAGSAQARRSGWATRPTERAKVIQENSAVLLRKSNGTKGASRQ